MATPFVSFVKPVLSLMIELGPGVGVEVTVNGFPVTPAAFFDGGPSSAYIPITPFLQPSSNRLEVELWPTLPMDPATLPKATVTIALIAWDADTMRPVDDEAVTLTETTFSVSAAIDHLPDAPTTVAPEAAGGYVSDEVFPLADGRALAGRLSIAVDPYSGWRLARDFAPGFEIPGSAWHESPALADAPATFDAVVAAYQHLWRVLEQGDYETWRGLNAERWQELSVLTSTPVEELQADGLASEVIPSRDGSWTLQPFDPGTSRMRFMADGRIVTLLNAAWEPVLRYRSTEDPDFEIAFPVYLRSEGRRFVIAR